MKYLKMLVIAIITLFTFGSAMAQVVVQARVGDGHHYRHHHRHHRYHHDDHR